MIHGEQSKELLNEYVEKLVAPITKRKDRLALYDHLKRKFDMNAGTASDIVCLKRDMAEFTAFQLFAIVYCLKRDDLGKFFTEEEIESLSNEKFEQTSVKFPLKLKLIQITDTQWIGGIDNITLMQWASARMFEYDPNQQRALQIIKHGEVEIRKPFVNRNAVREIKESMMNGTYIPDPITLNMTDEAIYSYDKTNCILTINEIPNGMFKLIDGYHRTIAMSEIYQADPDFRIQMQLQVVAFDSDTASAFVFQQDQKTFMKKVESDSYDPYSITSRIIARINRSPEFLLQNEIGRNGAKIDQAKLGKLIEYYWMTERITKTEQPVFITNTAKTIREKLNTILEQDADLLTNGFDDTQLFVVMFVIRKADIGAIAPAKLYSTYNNLINTITAEEKSYMTVNSQGKVRRKGVTILEEKVVVK